MPNFNLVNQSSLDKILKAEVFVHSDSQLRVAYIILSYTPKAKTFQAPKCVIKAQDPRLHRINVAALGFLIFDLILEGILTTTSILKGVSKVKASTYHPINKEKKEEKEKEEGEVFEVSNSKNKFEVFNQPLSPVKESHAQEASPILDNMGIQQKSRTCLLDVMESASRSKVPEKNAQAKLPPPPPTQPLRVDLAGHKRKRDQRNQDLREGGKGPLPKDVEP